MSFLWMTTVSYTMDLASGPADTPALSLPDPSSLTGTQDEGNGGATSP